jgi:hypothetical protein
MVFSEVRPPILLNKISLTARILTPYISPKCMQVRMPCLCERRSNVYLNAILQNVHPCLSTPLQKQSYLSMETSLGVAALLPF